MMRRIAREGWRQLTVLVAMLLVFAYLAQSLLSMQVLHSATLNQTMQTQYAQDIAAPQVQRPPRGVIEDDQGQPLVGTETVFKLAAFPPYVIRKATTARLVTDLLFPLRLPHGKLAHNKKAIARAHAAYHGHYTAILRQLERKITYVCLAGDDSPTCPAQFDISETVKEELIARLAKLTLPGITVEPRYRPIYVNGGLGAQVLGYVTYQYDQPSSQWVDAGQYGVQQYYNNLLTGIPGHASVRVDTNGLQIRVGAGANADPQQGATLKLTLDSYAQFIVQNVLNQLVQDHHPLQATIVVERPSDGAILAMASSPSYDPNNWKAVVNKFDKHGHQITASYGVFTNPAISDQYEPGSTFKPIMIASGLDSGAIQPWYTVDDTGQVQVGGYTVQNWCTNYCTFLSPNESITTMLKWSSNVGAVHFSRFIPVTTFYDYMEKFGLGQLTGIDLAGEVPGVLLTQNEQPPAPVWVPAYKDSTAYGQGGISVTPLQLVNAYATIANGGLLPQPHILQSYTLGGKTYTPAWPAKRRVLSQNTTDTLKQIMVQSDIDGEACLALLPGWDVAAKTGTAYESNGNGTYNVNRNVASTIAFAPVDNPQFVVLVVAHMPDSEEGSLVAAPAVHQILQQLFTYYKIPPPQDTPTQPSKLCPGPLR